MSTIAIIAIVVGAIVLCVLAGLAIRAGRNRRRRSAAGELRLEAKERERVAGDARAAADEQAARAARLRAEGDEKLAAARRGEVAAGRRSSEAERRSVAAREQHDRARRIDPDSSDSGEEEAIALDEQAGAPPRR